MAGPSGSAGHRNRLPRLQDSDMLSSIARQRSNRVRT